MNYSYSLIEQAKLLSTSVAYVKNRKADSCYIGYKGGEHYEFYEARCSWFELITDKVEPKAHKISTDES